MAVVAAAAVRAMLAAPKRAAVSVRAMVSSARSTLTMRTEPRLTFATVVVALVRFAFPLPFFLGFFPFPFPS